MQYMADKTFTCKTCNYKTNREFNYKVHLKSTKHQLMAEKQREETHERAITTTDVECPYCYKEYRDNSGLRRHIKKCKIKVQQDTKNKTTELATHNQQLLASIQKYKQMEKDYQTLQKEHHELMKKFIQHVGETTISKKDISYYIANSRNPADFTTLLETPLDSSQLEIFRTQPVDGIIAILHGWSHSMPPLEKSIHCVDKHTHQWIIYWGKQWRVDMGGENFLTAITDKVDNQIMLEFLDGDKGDYFLVREQIAKIREAISDHSLSTKLAAHWQE